jgi:hypothetical protein
MPYMFFYDIYIYIYIYCLKNFSYEILKSQTYFFLSSWVDQVNPRSDYLARSTLELSLITILHMLRLYRNINQQLGNP